MTKEELATEYTMETEKSVRVRMAKAVDELRKVQRYFDALDGLNNCDYMASEISARGAVDALEVGAKVRTVKGFVFTKLSDGRWSDDTTGLIWGAVVKESINWDDAMAKYGDKLPTKEEFETAEKHGIRGVIKAMNDFWFWSSSPRDAESAFYFSGDFGFIYYYGIRSFTYFNEGVVLVSGR